MTNENEASRTPHLDLLFGQAKMVAREVGQVAAQARDEVENTAGGMAKQVGDRMLDRMFADSAPKVPLLPE